MGSTGLHQLSEQKGMVGIGYNVYSEQVYITGDRHQTKQFCILDADCLVVGESQGSFQHSAGKYPVKPPRPEGDSQTIDTYHCRNN